MCLYGLQRSVPWNGVRKRNCSSGSVRELNVGRRTSEPVLNPSRHGNAQTCSSHCTLLPAGLLHVQGAICSGTRYVKWARGSCSQTHRRAAMCGFTQDNGYVQDVTLMHNAPRILANFWFATGRDASRRHTGIGTVLIPSMSRCLE